MTPEQFATMKTMLETQYEQTKRTVAALEKAMATLESQRVTIARLRAELASRYRPLTMDERKT